MEIIKRINCYKLLIKVSLMFWMLSYAINLHAYNTCGSEDWIVGYGYDDKKLNQKFKKLKKKMAPNDQEIKAAEGTKDFSEQLRVYKMIIERSRKAADFAQKHGSCKTMKIYRDYQYMVEKKLQTLIQFIKEQIRVLQENHEIKDYELHWKKKFNWESEFNSFKFFQEDNNFEEAGQERFDWENEFDRESEFNSFEFSQEKNNFEQEGGRYEHLRRNFNDDRIKKAEQSRNLDNQIWAREKTCQELKDLINIGEIFINIVNDWNNKWDTYEKIEGDHPWSPENIQKNIDEDVRYKDILRDEIETLHAKRYNEIKIKTPLQGFDSNDIFNEEEMIDHSLYEEDYDYKLQQHLKN